MEIKTSRDLEQFLKPCRKLKQDDWRKRFKLIKPLYLSYFYFKRSEKGYAVVRNVEKLTTRSLIYGNTAFVGLRKKCKYFSFNNIFNITIYDESNELEIKLCWEFIQKFGDIFDPAIFNHTVRLFSDEESIINFTNDEIQNSFMSYKKSLSDTIERKKQKLERTVQNCMESIKFHEKSLEDINKMQLFYEDN